MPTGRGAKMTQDRFPESTDGKDPRSVWKDEKCGRQNQRNRNRQHRREQKQSDDRYDDHKDKIPRDIHGLSLGL